MSTPVRSTIGERRWPEVEEFTAVASKWRRNASVVLMLAIWRAYGEVRADLAEINVADATDDIERELTEHMDTALQRTVPPHAPYVVKHEASERETRSRAPAKPPSYDLAFQLTSNPRVMWPIEAKVLRKPLKVADYTKTVRTRFLNCKYAPFCAQGTMLAYLLSGVEQDVFSALATNLKCVLTEEEDFAPRPHRLSTHSRTVPIGKRYPAVFTLHHMVLDFS